MFLDHPITGAGRGTFLDHYAEYRPHIGLFLPVEPNGPHNMAIHIAAENGLLGLGAFVGAAIVALLTLRGAKHQLAAAGQEQRALLLEGVEIAIYTYLATCMFLNDNIYQRYLWLLIALVIVGQRMADRSVTSPDVYRSTRGDLGAPHCHVFSRFDVGGMELGAVRVMNGLGRRYRYSILALNGGYEAAAQIDSGAEVTLLRPPTPCSRRLRALTFRAALREINPDLLITHNWGSMYAVLGALLGVSGRSSTRSTATVATARWGHTGEMPWLAGLLLRGVDLTIVPSHTLEAVAQRQYGVARQKLLRIPNGVDTDRFAPGGDRGWRRAHGVPDDALLVGWVGRLRDEKNLPLLLQAFARAALPDAWLAVVGDGPCEAAWRRARR